MSDDLFQDMDTEGLFFKLKPEEYPHIANRNQHRRFMNSAFGIYMDRYTSSLPNWVCLKNKVYVSQEYVFECLEEKDKIVFMFNLDRFSIIKSNPYALKTQKEYDEYFKKW